MDDAGGPTGPNRLAVTWSLSDLLGCATDDTAAGTW